MQSTTPSTAAPFADGRSTVAALWIVALALLTGCGGGGTLHVLEYSQRFEPAQRETFVVLAAPLEHPTHWAFGEPAAVISSLAERYQPPGTPAEVSPAAEAPAPLAALLAATQADLQARGYRAASGDEAPELIVLVSHSARDGHTTRVGLHLGGEVGDVFRPNWISLASTAEPADEADPLELLRDLTAGLPAQGAPADGD